MKTRLTQVLQNCALPKTTILLNLVACISAFHALPALSMPYNGALAQATPGYLKNTVCSFIHTQDVKATVNIRQSPSINAPVVAVMKRGDGVRAVSRTGNWVKIAARVQGTFPNEVTYPLQGWVFNQFINGCSEDQFDRWRK